MSTALSNEQQAAVDAILAKFDNESKNGLFPYPQHDRMDYAAMRVHAYSNTGVKKKSKGEYAILFEMLMFDTEAHRIMKFHGFCNQLFLFASNASEAWEDDILPVAIERDPDGPSVSMTEDNDEFIELAKERRKINPAARAVIIRDERVTVPHDPEVYKAKNIAPSDPLALRDLLRLLVETHREKIFSTDEEREDVVSEIGKGMKKLLTLDAFEHFNMNHHKSPSEVESMRMLAEVVVTGDPKRYAPTHKPNTDWRVIRE